MTRASSAGKAAPGNASTRHVRLHIAARFEEHLRGAQLDRPERWRRALENGSRKQGGRSPHVLMIDPGGAQAAIRIRPYRRGGWLGRFVNRLYLSPYRAIREFQVWQTLAARGAPLPEVVFARAERRIGLWQLHFATLDLPRARDGLAFFSDPNRRSDALSEFSALEVSARSIRAFHDAGGIHGDLNLRNLLFETNPPPGGDRPGQGEPRDVSRRQELSCWLVDLADARIRNRLTPAERLRDLMRLLRSAEKQRIPFAHSPRHHARFFSAYCGRDRALRAALLQGVPAEKRRLARHRLGWRLRGGKDLSAIAAATFHLILALALTAPLACHDESASTELRDPVSAESSWSLIATGDTGRTREFEFFEALTEGQLAVARAMTEEAQRAPVDALLLLGDNFYRRGLDRAHLNDRLRRNLISPYCYFLDLSGPRSPEVSSACPLEAAKRDPVPLFAVLGNHDLETAESPHLQRRVVPEFLPDWQMSSGIAEVFEIEEGISLILLESEVAIRDPAATRRALFDAAVSAKGPWRIVATHRPIATDDEGAVPKGGYPTMVQETLAAAAQAGYPVQLVLSAHHHNLQAFELTSPARLLQVGLGSGARAEGPLASTDHPAARFGATSLGFARIERVGTGAAESLSVRIIAAPRWPWLYVFQTAHEIARFNVDREGRVADSMQP